MRVGVWQDRMNYMFVDTAPLPHDITVDIPTPIVERYNRALAEWNRVQEIIESFSRDQERLEEYERLW